MAENEIVEAPAATPAADTPAVSTETPKETFDQTFDRVANEVVDGKRGPDGRYQSRVAAPSAPQDTQVPGSPQAAPPDPVAQVIEAPQSLPADVKAKWGALPPEVQSYWAKREGEVHQKFTTDGERLKSLSAYEEITKPLESRLKQLNAPAPEYFRRLAAADQLLASDGIQGLRQIAQMYGIDLRAALQPGNQPNLNPTQDIASFVDQKVEERLQQIRSQDRVSAIKSDIEKFVTGLPEDERSDFDALETVMTGLARANPEWSIDKLYKAARRADDATHAKDTAKAAAAAQKKAEEEAKAKAEQDAKLKPFSRRPGSAPAGNLKGKSMWDTMDRVAGEVFDRN